MKGLAPSLGFVLAVLVAGNVEARDLKTTTGEVFQNFAVTKKEPTGLRIQHEDGAAFVDFLLLSDADKKELGFDPVAYAAGLAEKIAAEKRRQQALAAQQAAILAARKAAAQADAGRDAVARDSSQRQPATVAEPHGVQATVETPGFSTQTYGSENVIIFDGTQPGVVRRIPGYFRPDGGFIGPRIIRRR